MTVIDEYLAQRSESEQLALNRVRQIVRQHLSDITETIGYGMPVLRYKNKYLLGFAAFKDHMSLFPGGISPEELPAGLQKYHTSKGTLQFTNDDQIPEALIVELIKARAAKIEDLA